MSTHNLFSRLGTLVALHYPQVLYTIVIQDYYNYCVHVPDYVHDYYMYVHVPEQVLGWYIQCHLS